MKSEGFLENRRTCHINKFVSTLTLVGIFASSPLAKGQEDWELALSPGNQDFVNLDYSGGLFVGNTNCERLTSSDGKEWAIERSMSAYREDVGEFFLPAPACHTFTTGTFFTGERWLVGAGAFMLGESDDGLNWTVNLTLQSFSLQYSHNFASNGNIVVVGGWNGIILNSKDHGNTWQRSIVPTGNDVVNISWTGTEFVALMKATPLLGEPQMKRILSTDGITWRLTNEEEQTLNFQAVAYSQGTFIAIDSPATKRNIYIKKSTDVGSTWEIVHERRQFDGKVPFSKVKALCTGVFVAFSPDASSFLVSRDDGQTWQVQETGFDFKIKDIASSKDTIIIASTQGYMLKHDAFVGSCLNERGEVPEPNTPSVNVRIEQEGKGFARLLVDTDLGFNYRVERSDNLIDWKEETSFDGIGTEVSVSIIEGQYYRVVQQKAEE